MMLIKIYGERNTGTNYLEKLLWNHLPDLELQKNEKFSIMPSSILLSHEEDLKQLGWKHRLLDANFLELLNIEKNNLLILTLTKNPYSWLLSLHKRPYAPIHLRNRVISFDEQGNPYPHTDRNIKFIRKLRKYGRWGRLFLSRYPQWSEYEEITFHDFIRARWFTQFNEGCDNGFKHPVELWNVKNKAYLELAKHYNALTLTYEELLADPKNTLQKIANQLNCSLESFNNIETAAKHEDIENKDKNHQFYRDYYLNERWRNQLTQNDYTWISPRLDPEVINAFGYELL